MDIAKGEATEKELDVFISKRDTQRRKDEGERAELEAWQLSARVHEARLKRENIAAWYGYLLDSADRTERVAAEIAAEKRAQAQKLLNSDADGDLSPAA